MFDHVTLTVSNLHRAISFYTRALMVLGFRLDSEYEGGAGFGLPGRAQLWLRADKHPSNVHLAFAADSRAAVDDFHRAAIAAGAKDNGVPGLRESYSPTYYAAFVHDADGNNIEAVYHGK